jgi:hypothetical protein
MLIFTVHFFKKVPFYCIIEYVLSYLALIPARNVYPQENKMYSHRYILRKFLNCYYTT